MGRRTSPDGESVSPAKQRRHSPSKIPLALPSSGETGLGDMASSRQSLLLGGGEGLADMGQSWMETEPGSPTLPG